MSLHAFGGGIRRKPRVLSSTKGGKEGGREGRVNSVILSFNTAHVPPRNLFFSRPAPLGFSSPMLAAFSQSLDPELSA